MSFVPMCVHLAREMSGLGGELDKFLDDDFGYGINPVEIFRPRMMAPLHNTRIAPYLLSRLRHHHHHRDGHGISGNGAVTPTVGKDGFRVCMDVLQFKPSELTVKTVDNTIIVEGKHEEREDDHGLIQRHFVRKYSLPKNFDAKDVQSSISSDGVLTVKAPLPGNTAIKIERIAEIQQTGPAHLNVKQPDQVPVVKQTQNGANNSYADKDTAAN